MSPKIGLHILVMFVDLKTVHRLSFNVLSYSQGPILPVGIKHIIAIPPINSETDSHLTTATLQLTVGGLASL